MKKLAILLIALAIFSISWHKAEARAEFDKKQQEQKVQLATKQNTPTQATPEPPQEPAKAEVAQEPTPEPRAPEIAPKAAVSTCGPQDPAVIYGILREIGVPRSSAIQLLGSWKTESHLDPCQKIGDGGRAWGLNSWHPNRRHDMPAGLREQINWAIHTEMKRDCASCYATIMAGGDTWTLRDAIKRTTRWGHQGARWTYADQFANMF